MPPVPWAFSVGWRLFLPLGPFRPLEALARKNCLRREFFPPCRVYRSSHRCHGGTPHWRRPHGFTVGWQFCFLVALSGLLYGRPLGGFFLLRWWSQRRRSPACWTRHHPCSDLGTLAPRANEGMALPLQPVDKAGNKPVCRPVETVTFCGQAFDCRADRGRLRYATPSSPWAATRQSIKAWAARLGWGESRHIATNWQS